MKIKKIKEETKKITLYDYLEENCICNPDTKDFRSCCGFPCEAKWHWSLEIERMKVIWSLGKRFNPDIKYL